MAEVLTTERAPPKRRKGSNDKSEGGDLRKDDPTIPLNLLSKAEASGGLNNGEGVRAVLALTI